MNTEDIIALAKSLESKPLLAWLDQVEHLTQQNTANAERLAQAMQRETALQQENTQLTADNAALKQSIEELSAHPQVRAAKRAATESQIAMLKQQLTVLQEPAE